MLLSSKIFERDCNCGGGVALFAFAASEADVCVFVEAVVVFGLQLLLFEAAVLLAAALINVSTDSRSKAIWLSCGKLKKPTRRRSSAEEVGRLGIKLCEV